MTNGDCAIEWGHLPRTLHDSCALRNTYRGTRNTQRGYVAGMDTYTLTDLGARIKAAREHAKMSQTDLAVACGWRNGSRVGNYEQGTREPSLSDLAQIAAETGVRMAWLVANALPMLDYAIADERATYDAQGRLLVPITADEARQLERIRSMPKETRIHYSAIASALTEPPKKSA